MTSHLLLMKKQVVFRCDVNTKELTKVCHPIYKKDELTQEKFSSAKGESSLINPALSLQLDRFQYVFEAFSSLYLAWSETNASCPFISLLASIPEHYLITMSLCAKHLHVSDMQLPLHSSSRHDIYTRFQTLLTLRYGVAKRMLIHTAG